MLCLCSRYEPLLQRQNYVERVVPTLRLEVWSACWCCGDAETALKESNGGSGDMSQAHVRR